MYDYI
jgi:hypothetical protein